MAGISNHGRNGTEPYATAGDRAYLVGTQDGNFPDLGGHVPGEMGGLWAHPIKLIDGFWATLTDTGTRQEAKLSSSDEFINFPYGGKFSYGMVLDSLAVERFQFSPDGYAGVIVQYTFRNTADRKRRLRLDLSVKTDLLPVWYSDQIGIHDSPDTAIWLPAENIFVARDVKRPWFAVWGAASLPAQRLADPRVPSTKGSGIAAASRYGLSVEGHGSTTVTFVFAGSAASAADARKTYRYLAAHHGELLRKKKGHYTALIQTGRISIPDPRLQEVYNWVKINTEWLMRDVPGMGRGFSGSLMEYPWWFPDNYTYLALIAAGNIEDTKETLRLLRDQSRKANGNGRIVHEVTTNGAVVNPGNTQETAQFVVTIGKLVEWTGDLDFAREMYPAMKQGLRWLLTEKDRDQDLFPEGYGIMEVLGLNTEVIDVAVYTQQALLATSKVAGLLGEPAASRQFRRQADELAVRINERFWIEDQTSYGDFYGTRAEAVAVVEGAIKQINLKGSEKTPKDEEAIADYERLKQRWAGMPDTTRAWITNENWVISTPMEAGIAPRNQAIRLLDRVRKENVGEYGPFLSAVEEQRMMTIATGVQAVAEAQYGRIDEAMWYIDKIVQTFNRKLPGSISEMMPDWGSFTIAWTMYGIVVPVIQHIFGIHSDAVNKTVVFDPHLPTGWEDISIQDLPIGTTTVSFARRKTAKGIEYDLEAKESGWTLVLKGATLPGATYQVNGRERPLDPSGMRLSGRKNRVVVIPQLTAP
jgi:Bacterial alpha-L-rhamnosidase 6 hairpin glycosidase domain